VTWTQAGLWRRLHRAALDRLGEQGVIDWSRAVVDAASVRAKGGLTDRPEPVDRGKPGSKLHVLTDRTGLPLAVAVRAAHPHDSLALVPLVQAIPAVRSRRRRPGQLHADKGYGYEHLRAWLRRRRIAPRIPQGPCKVLNAPVGLLFCASVRRRQARRGRRRVGS